MSCLLAALCSDPFSSCLSSRWRERVVPLLPPENPELDSVQGGPWRVPWHVTSKAAEASGSSNWRQRSQPWDSRCCCLPA